MRLIDLMPLQEIDFPNQKAFDQYNKVHKLRPDTKVTVAGRVTTAGRASQNSPTPAKGTSVFGNDDDIHPKLKDLYKQQFGSEPEEPKKTNIQSAIKNISDLTDSNDHNGAVMALAKMTGDKSYIEQMQKIQKYHELKGHMPQSLIKYRTAIMKNLLTQVQKKYGNKVAKQLNNAF
jgi:hypothetical protein